MRDDFVVVVVVVACLGIWATTWVTSAWEGERRPGLYDFPIYLLLGVTYDTRLVCLRRNEDIDRKIRLTALYVKIAYHDAP